jgi:hypothetical protein
MQFVTNRFGDTSSALGYLGHLLLKTTLSVKSCGLCRGCGKQIANLAISESYPSDKYVPPRPFNPLA